MEMWQKFIEKTDAFKPILEIYLKMRRWFQINEWSESDLIRPPFYSNEIMELRGQMNYEINLLKKKIEMFGIDYSTKEFNDYLRPYLTKIDELTPLKNGNNERGNNRDEDY